MMVGVPGRAAEDQCRQGRPAEEAGDRQRHAHRRDLRPRGGGAAGRPGAAPDAAEGRDRGDTVVYVRGDRGIEYGKVMTVLGQVGQAGFDKVSLIAEAQAGAPAP